MSAVAEILRDITCTGCGAAQAEHGHIIKPWTVFAYFCGDCEKVWQVGVEKTRRYNVESYRKRYGEPQDREAL